MLTIQLISSEKGNWNINNIKIPFRLQWRPKRTLKEAARKPGAFPYIHMASDQLWWYQEVLSNMGQIRAFLRPVFESCRQLLQLPGAPTGTAFALCWLLQYTELKPAPASWSKLDQTQSIRRMFIKIILNWGCEISWCEKWTMNNRGKF